jgi:hypothetical protein
MVLNGQWQVYLKAESLEGNLPLSPALQGVGG